MKKIYLTLIIIISTVTLQAQNTYQYSMSILETASDHVKVAVYATPNFTENNGNTAGQGIIIEMDSNLAIYNVINNCTTSGFPAITTCDYDSFPGSEWAASYRSALPSDGRRVFQVTRTEGADTFLVDAVNGQAEIWAILEIRDSNTNSVPISGVMDFVENGVYTNNEVENFMGIQFPSDNGVTREYLSTTFIPYSINFGTVLSTSNEELVGLSVYPNPVKDVVNIKGIENNLSNKVEVHNVTGQHILTTTNNLETINVSALQAGVYFMRITTKIGSKLLKIIKQ